MCVCLIGDCLSLLHKLTESSRTIVPEGTTIDPLINTTSKRKQQSGDDVTGKTRIVVSEAALIEKLFRDYDKRSRPVKSIDTPVVVTVDLYPIITEQLVGC